MTYLSVKALRHYHDVGLLAPVTIDPGTGYRRYASSQVATAQAIRRFRDLDMPIDDVRDVLAASDAADRNRVILQHLERMRRQLERTQLSVESLQALLEEEPRARADIELRRIPATQALIARRVVGFDDCGVWLEQALIDLHTELDTAGLTVDWFRWRPLSRRVLRGRRGRGHCLRARDRLPVSTRSSCPRRPSPCSFTTARSPTSIKPMAPSGRSSPNAASGHRGRSASTTSPPPAPRCAGRSRSERTDDHRRPHPRIHHL